MTVQKSDDLFLIGHTFDLNKPKIHVHLFQDDNEQNLLLFISLRCFSKNIVGLIFLSFARLHRHWFCSKCSSVHRNFFITTTKSKGHDFGNCEGNKYGSYKVNREGERQQVESNASREREG